MNGCRSARRPPTDDGVAVARTGLLWMAMAVFQIVWFPHGLQAADKSRLDEVVSKEGLTVENTTMFVHVGDNGVTLAERVLGEDDNRLVFSERLGLIFRKVGAEMGTVLTLRMYPMSPDFMPLYLGASSENVAAYDFDNDIRLDRVWYRYHTPTTEIKFGDLSMSLGKGIAFVADGEQEGWNRLTVRGAALTFEKTGRVMLGGYAGTTNAPNLDPVTRSRINREPADTVLAIQGRIHLAEIVQIGVHGVHIEPLFRRADDIDVNRLWVDEGPGIRISTAGALTDFRLGGVAVYVEANLQTHDNYRIVSTMSDGTTDALLDEFGYAGYGEMSWDSGPYFRRLTLRLVAEGLAYYKFLSEGTYRSAFGAWGIGPAVRYHRMPTLEPDWVLIQSPGNEVGGRLGAMVRLKRTDTQFTVSSNCIRYAGAIAPDGLWNLFRDVQTIHSLLSVLQPFRHREGELFVELGGRYEQTDAPDAGFASSGYLLHGSLRLATRLNSGYGIGFSGTIRRHRSGVIEYNNNYAVSDNTVFFEFPSQWRFELGLQYSDELTGENKNTLHLFNRISMGRNWFVQGEVRYEGKGVFEYFSASLSGGTTRGGYRCDSGSCRIFPDSVETMLTLRYRI